MVSKAARKRLKRINNERRDRGEEPIVRSVPKIRAVGQCAGEPRPSGSVARRRLPELHPLDKVRSKIDPAQYNAGNIYRVMYEKLERSGIDCTIALGMSGSSGDPSGGLWIDEHRDAYEALKRIKTALPDWEHEILRKVCGEAWPISDAVHAHAICHEDGTLKFFQNALNHLASAISGSRVPWRFHNEAYKQKVEAAA